MGSASGSEDIAAGAGSSTAAICGVAWDGAAASGGVCSLRRTISAWMTAKRASMRVSLRRVFAAMTMAMTASTGTASRTATSDAIICVLMR